MKNIYCIAIAFIVIFHSCKNEDDCGECFTPPQSFLFKLVNKETNENIFANGNYDPDQLEIFNTLDGNTPVDFSFISENSINLIQLNSIGWETEKVNLQIRLGGNDIFTVFIDAERESENCCSYTKYNEVKIEEVEFEQDSQTGIYTIFVKEIW